jgi:hypothetical protein
MKIFYKFLVCGFIIFDQFGCVSKIGSSGKLANIDTEDLPKSKIVALTESANRGDVSAAEALYKYYYFSQSGSNLKKGFVWLKWLAHHGVAYAEFNYGKILVDEAKSKDRIVEGLIWMLKGKKDGAVNVEFLLDRYQERYPEEYKKALLSK